MTLLCARRAGYVVVMRLAALLCLAALGCSGAPDPQGMSSAAQTGVDAGEAIVQCEATSQCDGGALCVAAMGGICAVPCATNADCASGCCTPIAGFVCMPWDFCHP